MIEDCVPSKKKKKNISDDLALRSSEFQACCDGDVRSIFISVK